MQPPTRKQLEALLASAKREGRSEEAAKLEARLGKAPLSPPVLAAPAKPPERKVEKRLVGFGPKEKAEEDERLLDD